MASIETVREMVQSLVAELNSNLKSTGYRVMFHQQSVSKGNMSLFVDPQSGRNKQRLYIHPATKYGQYKIVLSGVTLAARQKEFERIFGKNVKVMHIQIQRALTGMSTTRYWSKHPHTFICTSSDLS